MSVVFKVKNKDDLYLIYSDITLTVRKKRLEVKITFYNIFGKSLVNNILSTMFICCYIN